MRKITEQAARAFQMEVPFKKANTEVVVSGPVIELRLHGNMIARRTVGDGWNYTTEITTAGWDTVTTRERLNGLRGVDVHRSRGSLFLNGSEWDGELVEVERG